MRVAIYCTHSSWITHLETELEIAQNLLDDGHEVDFYTCEEKYFSCCENIFSRSLLDKKEYKDISASICDFCISRQRNGFNLLKGNYNKFRLINEFQINQEYLLDHSYLVNYDKLKSLIYDEFYDIGWSLLSSIISYTRNPFVNLIDYQEHLTKLYSDSIKVYESAKESIFKQNYERIYVFNGRFSYTKGLLRLGQKYGVPVYIHERGSVPEKYSILINKTPHDIPYFNERVNEFWRNGSLFKRKYLGKKYFKDKIKGFSGSWKSFTTNFKKDKLPDGYNPKLNNIVLFTSSEDEFVSIDKSWENPYFESQLAGIIYLCEEFTKLKTSNQRLYIRIHPNSKDIDEYYLSQLLLLSRYNNVYVIPPDSPISSYTLMFKAKKIITFGSTITMESVFWGKPVIMLGKSLYSLFNGPIIPDKFNDIKSLCFESNLGKPIKKDAIKIGYFMSSYGIMYKHYNASNYIHGFFKGKNISNGDIVKINNLRSCINAIKRMLFNV